jgi:hypothetical protein
MLIDQFAPHADFVERHSIEVPASSDAAYRVLWTTDFGSAWPIKLLLSLRSLPGVLLARGGEPRPLRSLTLEGILDAGFGRLAEAPGREIVLGVAGRFWRPIGNLEPFRMESFTGDLPAGLAKAVWNIAVREEGAGRSVVSTETRIVCADAASRLKFGAYWSVIRPFSGLIRIVMLRAIRDTCAEPRSGG